jgi:hypothetical protein
MFGLGKSPKEKLEKKYQKLMTKSHKLSHTDRTKSDKVRAEAEEVLDQIKEHEKTQKQ